MCVGSRYSCSAELKGLWQLKKKHLKVSDKTRQALRHYGSFWLLLSQNSRLWIASLETVILPQFQDRFQGMLDFDYVCRRETPSVACMIDPFNSAPRKDFYWGSKQIFIPSKWLSTVFSAFSWIETPFYWICYTFQFTNRQATPQPSTQTQTLWLTLHLWGKIQFW